MKRKMIVYVIVGTAFLSAATGTASLLATAPDSAKVSQAFELQQNREGTPPISIAKNGGKSPRGNSWGG